MKWVFFIIAASLVWPVSVQLRGKPNERLRLFALLGFLPYVTTYLHLYMAIDPWDWVGYVKGAELSILDLTALTLYLSLHGPYARLPFRISMAAYFFAVVLSATQAKFPQTALFYSWQIARVFLLYATVYRGICADPRVSSAILKGIAAGIIMEAGITLWQRFGLGVAQTPGTYVHQNTLGLVTHFVVFPFFALLLAGRRSWLVTAALLSGVIVEVLTASRGTILLAAFGFATVFLLSAARRWTSRKAVALLTAVASIVVIAPLTASSLQHRFAESGTEVALLDEDSERLAYKKAAADMLWDHPLGVGANNFTFVANVEGYFLRAGEASYFSGLSGNVHNIYWLTAAETGYIGLIALVILLLQPLIAAFACSLRYVGDERGDLLLGMGVTLLVIYLHSFVEWVFVTFDLQYPFAIEIGLVAGVARELGYWRRR